ncbi:MAG: butyrate kinase [Bacteroidetes bacterium GWF2_42_66]|nr:MAG: butyrate kinase [Bacteroidetes bacterium GWA2_42_15]OFX98628.1 MAG: butyrate kinase [Bacteroidetes bacterium GWE2_42_39]OFY43175.1 MAG: butyrate kinase [Bacteroidetes bacterium GWF2_42_66]HBL76972.1 butyrate kinase [Prolixibacteraceae bacterium]HCR89626.1 butyrate kinase [Prolixibacteraceae bacterium]
MSVHQILAINPGSTSTKFAVYFNEECRLNKTLRHSIDQLLAYSNVIDQFDFRKGLIIDALVEEGFDVDRIKFIIGRGGLTFPLESGIYEVNNMMLTHVRKGILGQHASNLGPLIADYIANQIPNARAFIADPVVTDELQDVARVTGHPRFKKRSIFHALNQKATARIFAAETGKKYEELNLIVAHLGGGISVGAHQNGRVIDVNNALDGDGPFSPERSGSLPVGELIKMCFSGRFQQDEIYRMVIGEGGFVAHLGTNNAQEVEQRAASGDTKAQLIQDALAYQVAKSIGQMAVVLNGKVDAILLTGGLAYNKYLCNYITEKTSFIAPLKVYPGEDELQALAMNVLRVARGEVDAKVYLPNCHPNNGL